MNDSACLGALFLGIVALLVYLFWRRRQRRAQSRQGAQTLETYRQRLASIGGLEVAPNADGSWTTMLSLPSDPPKRKRALQDIARAVRAIRAEVQHTIDPIYREHWYDENASQRVKKRVIARREPLLRPHLAARDRIDQLLAEIAIARTQDSSS